jgi:spore coat assembly protein
MFHVGDYVVRLSYGKDILFRITYISQNHIARLKGITYRLITDAPLSDLQLVNGMRLTSNEAAIMNKVQENVESIIKKRELQKKGSPPTLERIGKVLHLDGDPFYLNLCLKYYKSLGIPAIGEHIPESEQPKKVVDLIKKHSPDILVLTGHDALGKNVKNIKDITKYKNSKYFAEAVEKARDVNKPQGGLVIIAGACQSYFERLLEAGADFAASPARVLIHALDPVFVAERIAFCPFYKVMSVAEALEYTITNYKGIGGYEVLGKLRRGGTIVSVKAKESDEKEKLQIVTGDDNQDVNNQDQDSINLININFEDFDIDKMTMEQIEAELRKPIFNDTIEEFQEKLLSYIGNTIPLSSI